MLWDRGFVPSGTHARYSRHLGVVRHDDIVVIVAIGIVAWKSPKELLLERIAPIWEDRDFVF